MSQLSIKLSDKADALIAQLQKEIFNRRRKKVTAAGVVETLVESGARSQSDKRFATSWVNLIEDIEKAAKLANAHGNKPASLTDEEWVMVLSHRNRQAAKPRKASKAIKTAKPAATNTTTPVKSKRAASTSRAAKTTESTTTSLASAGKPRKARRARKTSAEATSAHSTAGRMAKAAAQLASANGIQSPARS
ncbi:MAG: hypothetical protein CMK50_03860 [Propionibacteriaceae bacterium]|jgi:Mg-chelatase subunit ChlI|nr:hypothetical protein [Propionibacteriaceae bacterium]MBT66080.1 hypothetical protein [Synechococcus sp. NP17]|tara:strand:+ start:2166 stop:2741 length:576 start_codon:yes stop_codon:yes gene_type:complete